MSSTDSSAQGFVDRVQSFVTENKRAILVGAALVVAAGGVALYASAPLPPKAPGDKKDKKKFVKPRPHDVESGPIIEEIPFEDQPSKPSPSKHWTLGLAEADFRSSLSRLWCYSRRATRGHSARSAFFRDRERVEAVLMRTHRSERSLPPH